MKRIFVLIFITIGVVIEINAQGGLEGFNYQAVLRDNANQPIKNQTITVTFNVLDSPGGNIQYTENHQVSTDELGLFNLVLGEDKPAFSGLNWGFGEKYLEVIVTVNGNAIPMGTTKFQAVPYAKYAAAAPATQPTGDAGGDLNGTYPNPTVMAIQNHPVSTKAPSNGQVLKWDSTISQWTPDWVNDQQYTAGPGIQVNGTQIINTGDTNASDDIINSSNAAGDVTGIYNNLTVEKIQNKKVSSALPANGQVLKWDSNLNHWQPNVDNNQTYSAGKGIQINGSQIDNIGDVDPADDVTTISIAGGDVSGTFSNLQINSNTIGSNEIINGSIKTEDIASGVLSSNLWSANGNSIHNTNSGLVKIGNTSGGNLGLLNINTTGKTITDAIYVEGPVTDNAIHLDPIGGTAALGIHPQSNNVKGIEIQTNNALAIDANSIGNQIVAEFTQFGSNGKNPTVCLNSNMPELRLKSPINSLSKISFLQDDSGIPQYWTISGDPTKGKELGFSWTRGDQASGALEFSSPLTLKTNGTIGVNNFLPSDDGALVIQHSSSSKTNLLLEEKASIGPSIRFSNLFEIQTHRQFNNSTYNYFNLINRGISPLSPVPFFSYFAKSDNTDKHANFYCDLFTIDALSNGGHVSIGGAGIELKGPIPYIDFALNGSTDYEGRVVFDGPKKSFNFLSKGKSDYVSIGDAGVDLKGTSPYIDFSTNLNADNEARIIYVKAGNGLQFETKNKGGYYFQDGPIRSFGSITGNYTYAYYTRNLIFPFTPLTGSQISGNVNYSIYSERSVVAEQFNAISDIRIKNIISKSNSINDLILLNNLNVTDYTYKDVAAKGSNSKKGFIAQEVEEVFPEAVSKGKDFIPNIYQPSSSVIFNKENKNLEVTITDHHDIKVGDVIKIIADKPYEKTVVSFTGNSFTVEDWEHSNTTEVFVYGTQVNDFRTVDYDRIFTLNVSATQELIKQVEVLKNNNKTLAESYLTLENKIELLESNLTKLTDKLSKASQLSSK